MKNDKYNVAEKRHGTVQHHRFSPCQKEIFFYWSAAHGGTTPQKGVLALYNSIKKTSAAERKTNKKQNEDSYQSRVNTAQLKWRLRVWF